MLNFAFPSFQAISCFLHGALVSLVESPHFLFIKLENKGAKDPFKANGHTHEI